MLAGAVGLIWLRMQISDVRVEGGGGGVFTDGTQKGNLRRCLQHVSDKHSAEVYSKQKFLF